MNKYFSAAYDGILPSLITVTLGLSIGALLLLKDKQAQINKIQDNQIKMSIEIGRLEKKVELINDAKTTLLRKITPVSGFTYYTVYTDKEGQVQYYTAH